MIARSFGPNGHRFRAGGGWGWGRVTRSLATDESKNDDQDGNGWPVIGTATVVVRGTAPIPPAARKRVAQRMMIPSAR